MLLLVSPGTSLFNKDAWRVHYQLLLADLSFSVLQYGMIYPPHNLSLFIHRTFAEKGLLVMGTELKIIIILDNLEVTQEFVGTLQSLKEKVPTTTPLNPLKVSPSRSLSIFFRSVFRAKHIPTPTAKISCPKYILPLLVILISFIVFMFWKLYNNLSSKSEDSNKEMYGPGLRFKLD